MRHGVVKLNPGVVVSESIKTGCQTNRLPNEPGVSYSSVHCLRTAASEINRGGFLVKKVKKNDHGKKAIRINPTLAPDIGTAFGDDGTPGWVCRCPGL